MHSSSSMPSHARFTPRSVCLAVLAMVVGTSSALGQGAASPAKAFNQPSAVMMDESASRAMMKRLGINPDSEAAREYLLQQAARRKAAKDLRKLRYTHFTSAHEPTRVEGLKQLKTYTDPALFPLMIDIFAREESDVRLAVLDVFVEQAGREGDAALAWEALFDNKQIVRDEAMLRLQDRIRAEGGKAPESVKLVLFQAVHSRSSRSVSRRRM
jgi:hypothetical protein